MSIDRQRLLEVAENSHVVDDQARSACLPRLGSLVRSSASACGSSSACRGKSSTSRHVKAGDPHRTNENHAQRVIRRLEFLVQVFPHQASAVRLNVQPPLGHQGDFILRGADDDGHVGLRQPVELLLQGRAFDRICDRRDPLRLPREHFAPMAANLVIHADRGRFVDGDEHRLAA